MAQFGFEEFVSDNVIILRNSLSGERRRRTIEVLKLRGGSHLKGEHLFTLKPGRGIVVIPQQLGVFDYASSTTRLPSGIQELDRMCNGGLFDKSLVMVSGATGTGKSLLCTHFVAGGVHNGETAVLHSFEESHDQLCRNARQWGIDFEDMERSGKLRIVAEAPESASLEDHLLRVKSVIDEFTPDRVAIDSLTALQRVATVKGFREYVLGISFHIKERCRLGLVTATTGDFGASPSVGDLHVSTISDTIVLLQYIGVGSEIRRGINVLKMRGSDHDKSVREFVVRDDGMHILEPFGEMKGVVTTVTAGSGTDSAWTERTSPSGVGRS